MAATPGNVDSGLSGQPSSDIDKQTGPASGSNTESAGSPLGGPTQPVQGGNNAANQASAGQSGSAAQSGSNANNANNAQQQNPSGGTQ